MRTVAVAIGLDPDDAVARLLPEPTPRRGIPVASLKRWLGAFSLLVVVLASGYLAVRVVTSWTPTDVISPDLRPRLRRDPVRELAEARGLIPPRPGAAQTSIDAGADATRDESPETSAPPADPSP